MSEGMIRITFDLAPGTDGITATTETRTGVIEVATSDTSGALNPSPYYLAWATGQVARVLQTKTERITVASVDIVRPVVRAGK